MGTLLHVLSKANVIKVWWIRLRAFGRSLKEKQSGGSHRTNDVSRINKGGLADENERSEMSVCTMTLWSVQGRAM